MTNPFERVDGVFFVLVNGAGQYCLWPVFLDIPAGWTAVHGPAGRDSCLDHVNAHWTAAGPPGSAAG